MRKTIVWLLLLVLAGYAVAQFSTAYKAKSDLERRVEYHLDFVDETSLKSVKQDIIHDAQKFGVALTPANINILYENTDLQTMAQKLTAKTGAQFINKRVAIEVHYTARVLGMPLAQGIAKSKLKQVQVRSNNQNSELKQVLDGPP
jgi:hypothetical protein